MRVLPNNCAEKIKSFKYVGSDGSMLYHYILSPFADYLVKNHIPTYVSPNLLTTISFFCTFIPTCILTYF